MSGRVIVVGSVNVDMVVTVDRLPAPGETVTGGAFATFPGGKGGNQAVSAARLGAPTWFVGAVGDDTFGAEARAELAADGVGLDGLVTIPGIPTGLAAIMVDGDGENLIAVASGANAALGARAVRAALNRVSPGPGDVVLVGHEIPTETARAALRFARAADARTILNPAPVGDLDRSTLALADILTPNLGELEQLLEREMASLSRWPAGEGDALDPEAAARTLMEANRFGAGVTEAILVTRGEGGALLVQGTDPAIELPAADVEVVDSVGAGDALNGALAAGLAAGLELRAAAERAVAAASLSVTRRGARGGLPATAELEAFLAR